MNERLQAFQNAIRNLQQEYGFQIVAQVVAEQHGDIVITKPVLNITGIAGWAPSENDDGDAYSVIEGIDEPHH